MKHFQKILLFSINNHRFALNMNQVDRVIQAVAVNPVPDSSPILNGLVDYHGEVIPVLNFRYRLKLEEKPTGVNDFFILTNTSSRRFFIIATEVQGIIETSEQDIISVTDLEPGAGVSGVIQREDGLYFIYDLEKFITSNEDIELEKVITGDE
ncbi:MAG: chemotaxis protein CheW [Bacteroidota bacterium]